MIPVGVKDPPTFKRVELLWCKYGESKEMGLMRAVGCCQVGKTMHTTRHVLFYV